MLAVGPPGGYIKPRGGVGGSVRLLPLLRTGLWSLWVRVQRSSRPLLLMLLPPAPGNQMPPRDKSGGGRRTWWGCDGKVVRANPGAHSPNGHVWVWGRGWWDLRKRGRPRSGGIETRRFDEHAVCGPIQRELVKPFIKGVGHGWGGRAGGGVSGVRFICVRSAQAPWGHRDGPNIYKRVADPKLYRHIIERIVLRAGTRLSRFGPFPGVSKGRVPHEGPGRVQRRIARQR